MKKKKWPWIVLAVVLALVIAGALVWKLVLEPKAKLSQAIPEALSALEQRWSESPIPILAQGLDESGLNTTELNLSVSDGVQYDMQVRSDMTGNRLCADGAVTVDGQKLNLSAYLDGKFAAITSRELLSGGYYGITYDTFSSDIRSFGLLSRLIPEELLTQWDGSVEKLRTYMNRSRQIPRIPEIQEQDIQLLMLGIVALPGDITRETVAMEGRELSCLCIDYSAGGEQVGALLGNLMRVDDPSQGEIKATFYLWENALLSAECLGRAGENAVRLALSLGTNPLEGEVSIALEMQENGETSAFSYTIGARESDGSHMETLLSGAQTISFHWNPETGDMLLNLPGKPPVSLNLTEAEDGFCVKTQDFAVLMGIDSQKDFDAAMTVHKGASIVTPEYKNLRDWSFEDLLVLLGGLGSLIGLK